MTTPTLPLNLIVDVNVQVQPQAVSAPQFNQGIIIGSSAVIPNAKRAVLFQGSTILAQMLNYGFTTNEPEYIAAQQYLSQTAGPTPFYLWIGLQDLTAIGAEGLTASHGGSGYAVGDTGLVVGGNGLGQYIVTGATAGVVTSVAIVPGSQGSGYSVASGLSTTVLTGGGNGALEVSISAIGESLVQALTACRNVAPQWYLAYCIGAQLADHIACATYAQTAQPPMQYFGNTSDASALSGAAGNVFSQLKALGFNRYQITYTTQQAATTTIATTTGSPNITLTSAAGFVAGDTVVAAGVPSGTTLLSLTGTAGVLSANATATASGVSTQFQSAPNNQYFGAALMGLAMGLNTGLAGSYFVLPFKTIVGMIPEPLSPGQLATITGNNGNAYVNYANSYSSWTPGLTGSGQYFDQILAIDMTVAASQYAIANAFFQNNVIPQNNPGEAILIHAANTGCQSIASIGSISGGTWSGQSIPSFTGSGTPQLEAGDSVPNGFINLAQSFTQQAAGARALRQMMPIYCCIILTEGGQSIVIGLYVQQ